MDLRSRCQRFGLYSSRKSDHKLSRSLSHKSCDLHSNTYSSKNTTSNYRTYKYDQYGQLIRENNEGLDKTFVYGYNNVGNIMSVKEYDFTLSDNIEDISPAKEYAYDSTYPDRLTNFNGSAIYYDSMGYPTSYGSHRFTWNKGKFTGVHRGSAQPA